MSVTLLNLNCIVGLFHTMSKQGNEILMFLLVFIFKSMYLTSPYHEKLEHNHDWS